ncbi:MAG: erythromycin esterase family protein [Burkholderiales bacterium]
MPTVPRSPDSTLSEAIAASAHILTGSADDYDVLLDLIGDARFVLLGEASHGTHEFYRERACITQRLIVEKGFTGVAVEADWPDAYRVNRYVRAQSDDVTSEQALSGFKRFPTWMWRNTDVVSFLDWLRSYNDSLSSNATSVGFYGLDLYSLFTSIDEILHYLDKVDPEAARHARTRYACFDHFNVDSQIYGYKTGLGLSASCESAVVAQLRDLVARSADYGIREGQNAADLLFHIEQNARLVVNAEQYYRTMFSGRVSSWNLRDRHMADTLDALAQHLSRAIGKPAKIVVWEHNSHIGDARATESGREGELNVGQLVRERYGSEAYLVGLTTYRGTVTAASDWKAPAERKRVRPAQDDSYEALFHRTGISRFMLPLREKNAVTQGLSDHRLERAIGVVYLPESERRSHYFYADLPQQFDAILHIDETRAVEPLERTSRWESGEAPETFPIGL